MGEEPGAIDHPLRIDIRPDFTRGSGDVSLVDLFAGCGGLTLGIAQALYERGQRLRIPLAVDFESTAVDVYRANFPLAERVELDSVETFFDGELGSSSTFAETRTKASIGTAPSMLVGGPPCQGHSNLNNHTRRVDAKNALYLRMVRAAEILDPEVVLIENVPAVLRDRHDGEGVVAKALEQLGQLGYQVDHRVVSVRELGVAQTRKRHLLLATKSGDAHPSAVFDRLEATNLHHDLEWAIGDLRQVDVGAAIDRRPVAKVDNVARMRWLLEHDEYDLPNELRPECHRGTHTYKSMYGRLKWAEPAQTITSGFGSIGQGRYMHPEQPRALTAHEAARIQGFPDYFDFSACPTRTALATMIGNAVPHNWGRLLPPRSSTSAESQGWMPTGRIARPPEDGSTIRGHAVSPRYWKALFRRKGPGCRTRSMCARRRSRTRSRRSGTSSMCGAPVGR
ncbi:DNA cytosine methyltransferase [Agromyces sp. MMS24-JH15]|uniref:DNA cytosine methyltransferase n=1 Tax=Agromyces sp. MMS24-JH15 TaxID=3243765 RepID=UPI003747939C